jgi:hypothetical protein
MKLFNRLFCRNRGFVPRSVTIITPDYRFEWISVKDRLPEKDVEVLVWDGYNRFIAYFSGTMWDSGYGWDMMVNVTVTHWMPLPDAPITKNEEDKDGKVGDDTM